MTLPVNRHFDCIKRCQNTRGGMAGGDCQKSCEKLPVSSVDKESCATPATPRVDAMLSKHELGEIPPVDVRYLDMCQFARQLERELADHSRALDDCQVQIASLLDLNAQHTQALNAASSARREQIIEECVQAIEPANHPLLAAAVQAIRALKNAAPQPSTATLAGEPSGLRQGEAFTKQLSDCLERLECKDPVACANAGKCALSHGAKPKEKK